MRRQRLTMWEDSWTAPVPVAIAILRMCGCDPAKRITGYTGWGNAEEGLELQHDFAWLFGVDAGQHLVGKTSLREGQNGSDAS